MAHLAGGGESRALDRARVGDVDLVRSRGFGADLRRRGLQPRGILVPDRDPPPSAAIRFATPSPMPDAPPVTTAVIPSNRLATSQSSPDPVFAG